MILWSLLQYLHWSVLMQAEEKRVKVLRPGFVNGVRVDGPFPEKELIWS